MNTSRMLYTIETLFDDESTREKHNFLSKFEVMADDSRNDDYESFWCALDNFLDAGKRYKFAVTEIKTRKQISVVSRLYYEVDTDKIESFFSDSETAEFVKELESFLSWGRGYVITILDMT